MVIVWLKFVHVAAIAVWCAGLIVLPGLFMRRSFVPNRSDLNQLQAMVRFSYVVIISPAAFIAVGSGIGLIFARETFEVWFSMKLVFVGLLVAIHILSGLVILKLFENDKTYPAGRFVAVTTLTIIATLGILYFVLAKPVLELPQNGLFEPGNLRDLVIGLSPWAI